ncbi:MAG: hypothetical protein DI637_07060 [Citromicrobium sp.]|nr:MAG: hypothetical protein DI637_07060 [Citromicrobium sp.]
MELTALDDGIVRTGIGGSEAEVFGAPAAKGGNSLTVDEIDGAGADSGGGATGAGARLAMGSAAASVFETTTTCCPCPLGTGSPAGILGSVGRALRDTSGEVGEIPAAASACCATAGVELVTGRESCVVSAAPAAP